MASAALSTAVSNPKHQVDVVVDGFRHADHGDFGAAALHFLGNAHGRLHGAVAADDEQQIDAVALQGVDHLADRLHTARGAENGAAALVDAGHIGRRQFHHLMAEPGNEPLQAEANAKDAGHVIVVVRLHDDRMDHVVEAGAKAAAGDDRRPYLGRLEIEIGPGTGQLKIDIGLLADIVKILGAETDADRMVVGNEPAKGQGRGYCRHTKGGDRGVQSTGLGMA
jgi:hypothetical protein